MGAWGTAIFSDDLAADVRGEWRELLLDGAETEAAATTVKERFRYAVDEEDDSVVFWLALAAAQMETGRPKRLRREKPLGVRFELGDVLLLRSESGKRRALAVVVAQNDGYPRGTVDPVLELLAWDGGALPTRRQMQTMPTVKHLNDLPPGREPHLRPHLWVVFTARKDQIFTAEFGEILERGVYREPSGDPRRTDVWSDVGATWLAWPALCGYLDDEYAEELRLTLADERTSRFPWPFRRRRRRPT